jgi:hypothetical protein
MSSCDEMGDNSIIRDSLSERLPKAVGWFPVYRHQTKKKGGRSPTFCTKLGFKD